MKRALLSLLFVSSALGACDAVTIDDQRSDNRLYPARGVVRGTVTYQGARPCSRKGHVVGSAVLLAFDRRNPPPPAGLANTAVNFATVPGDVLFPNEPRNTTDQTYCPRDSGNTDTIAASAPFEMAPLDAGSYIVLAFYDATGNFLPTFKFRNLPELGDVAGGYIDTTDAAKHLGDPSYQPIFLPVDVGNPDPLPPDAKPGAVPHFTMPPEGFVAPGVAVTLGARLPFTRPYFYPEGAGTPDPNFTPVLTMTQDHAVLAQPANPLPNYVNAFQASFKALKLNWGVPAQEAGIATDPSRPFHLQLAPAPKGGLLVWSTGVSIPETQGQQVTVPQLWPLVVLAKLDEEANGYGLIAQGSADKPVVVIQAITLFNDTLLDSALSPPGTRPDAPVDHLTALVRPSVICFDARRIDQGGVLVTPHFTGKSPDPSDPPDKPLVDPVALKKAQGKLLRDVKRGCLPTGKYGINVVYPTGQAWTVPNEMGACAGQEGDWDTSVNPSACGVKPRPVLASQGFRAVLQIVEPTTPEGKALCATEAPVPPECLKNP